MQACLQKGKMNDIPATTEKIFFSKILKNPHRFREWEFRIHFRNATTANRDDYRRNTCKKERIR